MTNLLQRLRGGSTDQRSITTVDDYLAALNSFTFGGTSYGLTGVQTTMGRESAERITTDFAGMSSQVFGRSSVVFACMLARLSVFSSVRFQYQRFNAGRPSELFGDQSLRLLERPWEGGTTGDLLTRMIVDADLAGNSYWTVADGELVRLRPDWVDIILEPRVIAGSAPGDKPGILGYRKIGYAYWEGGERHGHSVPLPASEVAHFAPLPDPLATYRGMSWLTPLVREVAADEMMIRHKHKFFQHGATPNMIVKHEPTVTPEQARAFKLALDDEYAGVDNAYKTMHLGGGADATVVGSTLQQIDFKVVQGHGETRIAAAAGVPPIIVGLSEGLEAATYSNYGQARRRFADGTMHPLWQNMAGSMERIRPAPSNGRLWYDTRDVAFLREDSKDAAEIAAIQAQTMRTLIDGGYTPESVSRAVMSGDFGLLEHSGLLSVQLQQPGSQSTEPAQPGPPALNGRARDVESLHA